MSDDSPNVTTVQPGTLGYDASVSATNPPVIPPSSVSPAGPPPDLNTTPQPPPPMPGGTQPLPPRPPGTSAAAQPTDKARFFREMLGNFFYAAGTGLANAGHGPGAEARGAGAALTALPERDIQRQQLEIQRQQASGMGAYHQAQATALQNRSGLVQVPMMGKDGAPVKGTDGNPVMMTLPADQAEKYMQATGSAAIRAGGQEAVQAGKGEAAAAARKEGEVTITPDIGQRLGLSPDLVGKNLNPAQLKVLAPTIKPPNLLSLIGAANKGDKDAQAILDTKQKMDEDVAKARGLGFGQGRATYQFHMVMDPDTGETYPMSGVDILRAQQQGKNLVLTGNLPQDKIIAVQQLQSEALGDPKAKKGSPLATGAIQNFESAVKAFDNPGDKAIFARVMKGAGEPTRGDEASWLGNIFNQAAKENLSPEGKLIATQYGPRLAETMGRLRGTLGLQATDTAMGLTLRLIPGGSTPDSSVAKGQLNQIKEMIQQATGIPAFHGKAGGPKGTPTVQKQGPNVMVEQ